MCSFLLRILKQFKGDPLLETRVSALFILLGKIYEYNIKIKEQGKNKGEKIEVYKQGRNKGI